MKKYMAIYMAPISALEQMTSNTPEQMKAGMDAWMGWAKKNEAAITSMGTPLGKTKRVSAAGVSDVKNEVCGYTIVQADSHDAAAALFSDHPHFGIPGGSIDVMECMDMPGM